MTDDPMDIVSRLRRIVREERGYKNLQMHCVEAADEIERLRGLITQMVDAYDFRVDGVISADDYLMGVLDLLRDEARRD